MDNHTQYSGFAGVDLAKKIMQIHFVTEDGEITDRQVKRAEFLDSSETGVNALSGWKPAVLLRIGPESLRLWDMKCT